MLNDHPGDGSGEVRTVACFFVETRYRKSFDNFLVL
jgi:hypothetical protein